ncbi:hypothetical protein CBR65_09715 [Cellvibrio sp. PSBB006]|nr:hypothetical protein CBR65_09715 [Cellvibrio sp. PSBB006]
MVDAVLLILREILEAAMIISLLLALSRQISLNHRWILVAMVIGILGSWLLAYYAYAIAEALEGVGQELLNATLYSAVILSAILLSLHVIPLSMSASKRAFSERRPNFFQPALYSMLVITVSCSVAREGSEIWIYVSGFLYDPGALQSAMIGGAIGAGIGMSLGAIAYYLFVFMPKKIFLPFFLVTVTLVVGGLSMQVAKQFMQIGWLESAAPMWDSSFLVSEQSWLGELLYALLGYDASPSMTQGAFYLAAIMPTISGVLWHVLHRRENNND